MERAPILHWYQWVGIPLLALFVILALLGTFGPSQAEASRSDAQLSLRVEYPSRFRYKQIAPLRVWVANIGSLPLDTVTVVFDRQYINQFSQVSFTPSAEKAYEIELVAIMPGETNLVQVQLRAESYGAHPGVIQATTGGADTVTVQLSTLVFP